MDTTTTNSSRIINANEDAHDHEHEHEHEHEHHDHQETQENKLNDSEIFSTTASNKNLLEPFIMYNRNTTTTGGGSSSLFSDVSNIINDDQHEHSSSSSSSIIDDDSTTPTTVPAATPTATIISSQRPSITTTSNSFGTYNNFHHYHRRINRQFQRTLQRASDRLERANLSFKLISTGALIIITILLCIIMWRMTNHDHHDHDTHNHAQYGKNALDVTHDDHDHRNFTTTNSTTTTTTTTTTDDESGDDSINGTTTTTTNHRRNFLLEPIDICQQQQQQQNNTNSTLPFISTQQYDLDEYTKDLIFKRSYIRYMARVAFNAYAKYAMGSKVLAPRQQAPIKDDDDQHTQGHFLISSLSTLAVMNLTTELNRSLEYVVTNMNVYHSFNHSSHHSVAAHVRHYLGGLLSAYALTGNDSLLELAKNVADKLKHSFDTPTNIPRTFLTEEQQQQQQQGEENVWLSDAGGQHLEYLYLSLVTNDTQYMNRVHKCRDALYSLRGKPAEIPLHDEQKFAYRTQLNVQTDEWTTKEKSLDWKTILFYSYLIKSYLLLNGDDIEAFDRYVEAMKLNDQMIHQGESGDGGGDFYYVTSEYDGRYDDDTTYRTSYMHRSSCALSAMFALGVKAMQNEIRWSRSSVYKKTKISIKNLHQTIEKHRSFADGLIKTCHHISDVTQTKLPPEWIKITRTYSDVKFAPKFNSFDLSHELAESYFILWRLTHEEKYRQYAWQLAEAIDHHCRENYLGYYMVKDVTTIPPGVEKDEQPPLFISGTLKYLYLIFCDDSVMSLNRWVFNGVGHVFPVWRQ